MSQTLYCAIMAGGHGNRLWPLSQQDMPKQFLDLTGAGRTMLQLTFDRFEPLCDAENIVVVTTREFVDVVAEQLPELPRKNILAEPQRRNTAACIAFATAFFKQKDPNAVFVVTPSDHLVIDPRHNFAQSILTSADFAAENDALMTIGVRASKPETTFGYIQAGEVASGEYPSVRKVKTFTEKPNAEMAQVFYECGEFCWNAGVFVWRVPVVEAALQKFLPALQRQFDVLDSLPTTHWTPEAIQRAYDECENISIDYGVLEKAQNVFVVETNAAWNDLGSWDALYEIGTKDKNGNAVLNGNAMLMNSHNCIVRVEKHKTCQIDGLDNYLVVEKGDYIFICPRANSTSSWKYAAEMKAASRE